MKLSIIVPAHNEADNLLPLLTEIQSAMASAETYEMIVVDDGSSDQTAALLRQAQSQFQTLRVLRHNLCCGQSTSIRTGVRAATQPWIATLDGDGQNDPGDIPTLYQALEQGRQTDPELWMIAGWRQRRHDSAWRLFSSRLANGVRSSLLGDHTPDTGCGLKLFARDKFLELPYFDHMHRFLPALMLRAGYRVISVPVNHRARTQGRSKYGTLDRLWAGIIDLAGVIWLQTRAKRPVVEELRNG